MLFNTIAEWDTQVKEWQKCMAQAYPWLYYVQP